MDHLNDTTRALFTTPICPTCATAYDPSHYDFTEDRACCSNCGLRYRVPDEYVPDIPDDDLDVGDDAEGDTLATFRAAAERLADQTAKTTGGASYELYARRFSEVCAPLIEALDAALRAPAVEIARYHGYHDDAEDGQADFGAGCCMFSGIEEDCCHCGRHP